MKASHGLSKKGIFAVVLMGVLLTQYQNCSNYSDPSPFDQSSKDTDAGVSPQQVNLMTTTPKGDGDSAAITGACSFGPYKSYSLNFQLSEGGAVRASYQVVCDHGRFHFVVPTFPNRCSVNSAAKTFVLNGTMKINDQGSSVKPITSSVSWMAYCLNL